MGFLSPGAAAAASLESFMVKREMDARQARLDAQAAEKHRADMERAAQLLKREQLEQELKLEDRERAKTEKEIDGMIIGDIPTEDLTVRARKHGIPLRTKVVAPEPVEVQAPGIITEMSEDGRSGETPVAPLPEGSIRFAGSPEQVKEAEMKAAQQRFIESLTKGPQAQPGKGGTGAAQSAAARMVGLPMSAADFEPPADRAKSAALQEYEFYKSEEIAAGRKPLGFDAYQERDANRKRPVVQGTLPGGELTAKQMGLAIQVGNAMKSDPVYTDMVDIQTGYLGVKNGLSQKNGMGDIAAINALQRMLDPGATVREGDVKLLQSANAFMERMNPTYWLDRLQKGDKLPEGTRNAMLQLAQQLYSVRLNNYDQMSGKKYKELARQGGLPFSVIGADFLPADGPASAQDKGNDKPGMPKVGDTFMGGKVISVD